MGKLVPASIRSATVLHRTLGIRQLHTRLESAHTASRILARAKPLEHGGRVLAVTNGYRFFSRFYKIDPRATQFQTAAHLSWRSMISRIFCLCLSSPSGPINDWAHATSDCSNQCRACCMRLPVCFSRQDLHASAVLFLFRSISSGKHQTLNSNIFQKGQSTTRRGFCA